ncbi:MAG: hypothetical protein IJH03_01245, partial [Clostridia bacterium]|nr:hypothetical protein [Clostridia bacterium]
TAFLSAGNGGGRLPRHEVSPLGRHKVSPLGRHEVSPLGPLKLVQYRNVRGSRHSCSLFPRLPDKSEFTELNRYDSVIAKY